MMFYVSELAKEFKVVSFNMKIVLRISLCLALVFGASVKSAFVASDITLIRQLADKFTVTADQQSTFLTKAQGLVATFSSATTDQRQSVISSIEDARFGGTMASIQTQLDTLLATAKATPAGLAGSSSTSGNTSSSGSVAPAVANATYVDRIAALQALIDGFRYKQPTDADRAQVLTVVQSIFNDRADSFSDERQRFAQVLANAQVLLYRTDATIKPQIDAMISQLSVIVPFDIQLTYQKQLYSNFSPLTDIQKKRILKHFQEMTDMTTTLTDVSLNNDFRDLLQFSDVAFFQDDVSAHSQMVGYLTRVKSLDPVFSKSFSDIISTLKTQAPTVAAADISGFVSKVQTVVNMRYGNKSGDEADKVANCTALQDLLNTLILLPPFNASVAQLTLWLGMVKADNLTTKTQTFGARIDAYSTNDFMLKTYDAANRSTFLTALEQLMNDRYGSTDADRASEVYTTNKQKLNRLLTWVTQISWFSDNLTKLNGYLALVAQDPATPPPLGTALSGTTAAVVNSTTATGTFTVVFGSDISNQLTQLEQSLGAINSDNQRELFVLSLYEVVSRKASATTVDVGRMRALAQNARSSLLLGTTYAGFCGFILAGVDKDFDVAMRNQLYVDFVSRISNMTMVVDQIQEYFLSFSLTLVNAVSSLSRAQTDALGTALQQVSWRSVFAPSRINDVKDLYTKLNQSLGNPDAGLAASTATGSTITVDATGATVITGGTVATTPTTVTSTVPASSASTTPPPPTIEQQRAATRALLNARQNSWR